VDSQDEFDKWTEAVRVLRQEDHYLLVLIDAAETGGRPRGDVLRLVAVAMAIFTVFVAIVLLATLAIRIATHLAHGTGTNGTFAAFIASLNFVTSTRSLSKLRVASATAAFTSAIWCSCAGLGAAA